MELWSEFSIPFDSRIEGFRNASTYKVDFGEFDKYF